MNELENGVVMQELIRAYELKDALESNDMKYTLKSEIV